MKIVSSLVGIFIVAPIWYYLLYKLLSAAGATDLMWFLYIIYLPASLFVHICQKIAETYK